MRLLSYSQIKQITEKFKAVKKIRSSYLFCQGDPANYVYIVKRGEFRVSYDYFVQKPSFEETQTEKIFKAPLDANKHHCEHMKKNKKTI